MFTSDFADIVRAELSDIAAVEPRARWGFGTMQIVIMHDQSCMMLQRYETTVDSIEIVPLRPSSRAPRGGPVPTRA